MPPPTEPTMGVTGDPLPLRLQALRLAVEVSNGRAWAALPPGALRAIELLLAEAQSGYLSIDNVRRIVRALGRL